MAGTAVVNASLVSHSVRPELVEGFEHIKTTNIYGDEIDLAKINLN